MKRTLLGSVVVMLFACSSSQGLLTTLNFENITHNNLIDEAIGESQLFVDVNDISANEILFTFRNEGPDLCSIARIYFDDDSFFNVMTILDSPPDVDFDEDANPPVLPGGNGSPIYFDVAVSAGAVPAAPFTGVNPSEKLGVLFDLKSGKTPQDVIDCIESGDLRIGIHVIAFESEGSESFMVPEPATIWFLGLSVAALLPYRKRH